MNQQNASSKIDNDTSANVAICVRSDGNTSAKLITTSCGAAIDIKLLNTYASDLVVVAIRNGIDSAQIDAQMKARFLVIGSNDEVERRAGTPRSIETVLSKASTLSLAKRNPGPAIAQTAS